MIINFFKNLSEPTFWVDYSTHEDCIFSADIEDFNPDTHTPKLVKDGEKYLIEIDKIPEKPRPPESPDEKFTRIFTHFANPQNPLETEKLEGIEFNDKQIGDLILARVFGGNPHAESALQAKILDMLLSGKQDPELLQKAQKIKAKINEIREFFALDPL